MRPSTRGCCWSPPGRGAPHFSGPCCRCWPSAVVENIAFHTSYFGSLLQDRLFGFAPRAFNLHDARWLPDRSPFHSANPTHSGEIPQHPGPVDRAGIRGRIPRRCGPPAPLSGTHLISRCSGGCMETVIALNSAIECTSLSPSAADLAGRPGTGNDRRTNRRDELHLPGGDL